MPSSRLRRIRRRPIPRIANQFPRPHDPHPARLIKDRNPLAIAPVRIPPELDHAAYRRREHQPPIALASALILIIRTSTPPPTVPPPPALPPALLPSLQHPKRKKPFPLTSAHPQQHD